MAYLVQSLVNLRAEIDGRWPDRDRTTDGWLWGNPGYSYGHSPDEKGAVHAIDVDADGVNMDWIVENIYKLGNVLYYVIWNRAIYGQWNAFNYEYYSGENPHIDHGHFEVYRTWEAENYAGNWNIWGGDAGVASFGYTVDQGDYGESDALPYMNAAGDYFVWAGDNSHNWAARIRDLRN